MVVFHSYVSLPEGKCYTRYFPETVLRIYPLFGLELNNSSSGFALNNFFGGMLFLQAAVWLCSIAGSIGSWEITSRYKAVPRRYITTIKQNYPSSTPTKKYLSQIRYVKYKSPLNPITSPTYITILPMKSYQKYHFLLPKPPGMRPRRFRLVCPQDSRCQSAETEAPDSSNSMEFLGVRPLKS